jgi:hypothetical protein
LLPSQPIADESVPGVKFGPPPAGHGYGAAVLADAEAAPATAAPDAASTTASAAAASRPGRMSFAIARSPAIDTTSGPWSDPNHIAHKLTKFRTRVTRPVS